MGDKIDDDERGISSKGIGRVTLVRNKPIQSGHDALGGRSGEEDGRRFFKYKGRRLTEVIQRYESASSVTGDIYVEVERGKLKVATLPNDKKLTPGDLEIMKRQLKNEFEIDIKSTSIRGFKSRGYATIGSMIGIAGGLALVGGLMEAVQWLEFPEQIDEIKRSKIDPLVVQRALYKSQLESVSASEINRLKIVNDIYQGKNYPTNILIDSETGILYCVILEATEIFSVGEIVGVKALSVYDKNSYSKIFRDYDEGYTYAFFPGDGWGRFHFKQQPEE
jgi:hypothetical protein